MLTKLFVFGFPGSGKSTVAQYLVGYVNFAYKHWLANRISDYNILYNMAHRDKKSKDFYLMNYRGTEGFYVSNPAKYNEALKDLEELVDSYQTKSNRLLVIEFARSDYARAFKVFKEDFFRNSSFLYVYADMNVCMQRIEERIRDPHSRDDHYVSNYTFANYLGKDEMHYPLQIRSELISTYTGKDGRFKIIDSNGSLHQTQLQAKSFVDQVIREGAAFWPWEMQEMQEADNGNTESRLKALSLILP